MSLNDNVVRKTFVDEMYLGKCQFLRMLMMD